MPFFERLAKRKVAASETKEGKLPVHIAIIMDGNGRWAKQRGLSRSIGHREGSTNLKKIVRFCDKIGIKYLTVFAFSTENWKRPKNEVDSLMSLMLYYLRNAEQELGTDKVRIRVIGDVSGLSEEIRKEITRVTELTKNNSGIILNIALNYGGRDDIVSAAAKIAEEARRGLLRPQDVTKAAIEQRLYTAGIPDPDLIIRTSGEKRISNFMLWQAAYSEFWYTDAYWPDFTEDHITQAIKEFQNRQRRYGGV